MSNLYTTYTDDKNYNIITNIKCIIYDVKKKSNNLPLSIVNLKYHQDKDIIVNNLSSNLKILKFSGSNFNSNLNNLPYSLTYLYTGYYFHKELEKLPHSLKELLHGDYFSEKIKNLPPNLIKLDTGRSCDSLSKNLPITLTHIILGLMLNFYDFNYMDILPGMIKRIDSYCDEQYFNSNNLPKSLLYLNYRNTYHSSLKNLPSKLKYLNVGTEILDFNNLPFSLKKVCLEGSPYNNIQNSRNLTLTLSLELYENNDGSIDKYNKVNNLPINLKNLDINDNYNMLLNNLPSKINIISIGNDNSRYFNNLPKSIKYFTYYCKNPSNKIPLCNELIIRNLTLNNNNNLDFIPEGVKQLKILNFENHEEKKIYLNSENTWYTTQNISYCKINDLPSSINKIIIDKDYKDNVNKIYHDKLNFDVYGYSMALAKH